VVDKELKEAIKEIDKIANMMGGKLGDAWPIVKAAIKDTTAAPKLELNTTEKLQLAELVVDFLIGGAPASAPRRRGRQARVQQAETLVPEKRVTPAAVTLAPVAPSVPLAPVAPSVPLAPVPVAPAVPEVGKASSKSIDDFDQGFSSNIIDPAKAAAILADARRKSISSTAGA
jgi:hypothetical protein